MGVMCLGGGQGLWVLLQQFQSHWRSKIIQNIQTISKERRSLTDFEDSWSFKSFQEENSQLERNPKGLQFKDQDEPKSMISIKRFLNMQLQPQLSVTQFQWSGLQLPSPPPHEPKFAASRWNNQPVSSLVGTQISTNKAYHFWLLSLQRWDVWSVGETVIF